MSTTYVSCHTVENTTSHDHLRNYKYVLHFSKSRNFQKVGKIIREVVKKNAKRIFLMNSSSNYTHIKNLGYDAAAPAMNTHPKNRPFEWSQTWKTNASLKHCDRKVLLQLCNILNTCTRLEYFPKAWKHTTNARESVREIDPQSLIATLLKGPYKTWKIWISPKPQYHRPTCQDCWPATEL